MVGLLGLEGQALGGCGRATGPPWEARSSFWTYDSRSVCLLGLVALQETHCLVPVVGQQCVPSGVKNRTAQSPL